MGQASNGVYPAASAAGMRKREIGSSNRKIMSPILSVSIHEIPKSENLRAFLWNGRIAKSDSMLMVAEFVHQNIFASLRALRESVKEWAGRNGKPHVLAISDSSPCWPINAAQVSVSEVRNLEIETKRHITDCGGYKGLHCLVFRDADGVSGEPKHRAVVYDVLPLPPPEKRTRALIDCSFWSGNLFDAAEELQTMARASARRQNISTVIGLGDEKPCWPEGLGEMRFQ